MTTGRLLQISGVTDIPSVQNGKFVLQGFNAQTHLDAVRWVLACPNLNRGIFSLAFINRGGVDLLANELQQAGAHLTIFAGIRNEITSRQGLEGLLDLGVTLYTVDTGGRSPLFHPKVFFAKGQPEARLVIGSANLTAGGLNNNIEASLQVSMAVGNPPDDALMAEITAPFDILPGQHPANVERITKAAQLVAMQSSARLLDESVVLAPRPVATGKKPSDDKVPKIVLVVKPIYPTLKKAPAAAFVPILAPSAVKLPARVKWEQVWVSKPLTERDLSIPAAKNTHPTGSMNLDKGMLPEAVDHRHYFRDNVFSALPWTAANARVDEAQAVFQLVVKDIEYGEASLRVAHTTSMTSAAYVQRNAMTRLSWGPLKPYIADADLIDRTLTLYRDADDPTKFLIEID